MSDGLPETLAGLRGALTRVDLSLELPDVAPARAEVAALLRQLDDYLLPRLARLDAPLLVVVGGSTGAGKSTLVNSIVGRPVSPAGVLRRPPALRSGAPADHRGSAADSCQPDARDEAGCGGVCGCQPRGSRPLRRSTAPDLDRGRAQP